MHSSLTYNEKSFTNNRCDCLYVGSLVVTIEGKVKKTGGLKLLKISDFYKELNFLIEDSLVSSGFFKVSSDHYVRLKSSHEINVIFIQRNENSSSVCINFGVHYDFLPKLGSLDCPDNKIELSECEIKIRFHPEALQSDYWWDVKEESIAEIAFIINSKKEITFDSYDVSGDIANITPKEFEMNMPSILSSLTKVRACFILARLNEELGRNERAADFARLGLKCAGMAVGPKKLLKDIIKRIENTSTSSR